MKKYRKAGKKFFAICFCGKEAEGIERPKPANSGRSGYTNLYFVCECGNSWVMDKNRFLNAIHGGFHNGSGKWIACDKEGYVIGKRKFRR